MRGLTDEERYILGFRGSVVDPPINEVALVDGLVERGLMSVVRHAPVYQNGRLEQHNDFATTDRGLLALRVDEAARKVGVE